MDATVAAKRFASRHPHALAAALALAVLASLVAGPGIYRVVTDKHTDGRWILDAAPTPIAPGLTVTIEDNEIRGEGPCNTFGSGWSQDDGPIGEFGSTVIGCPPLVAAQEEAYFNLLGDTETVEVDDDRLTLSGPSGRLTYLRVD